MVAEAARCGLGHLQHPLERAKVARYNLPQYASSALG